MKWNFPLCVLSDPAGEREQRRACNIHQPLLQEALRLGFQCVIAAVTPVSVLVMHHLGGWICWMMHHLSTYHSRHSQISLRCSWRSSSPNPLFCMWWHKSGPGAKALFQKIDPLPTRHSSSGCSLTTVTHLSSHCSHFSLAPVDEYTLKQEAAGVQRANLSDVDFPKSSDLYISLAQHHTRQSGPDCAESSSVKRKKISLSFR